MVVLRVLTLEATVAVTVVVLVGMEMQEQALSTDARLSPEEVLVAWRLYTTGVAVAVEDSVTVPIALLEIVVNVETLGCVSLYSVKKHRPNSPGRNSNTSSHSWNPQYSATERSESRHGSKLQEQGVIEACNVSLLTLV
jgi:hypothetical protein